MRRPMLTVDGPQACEFDVRLDDTKCGAPAACQLRYDSQQMIVCDACRELAGRAVVGPTGFSSRLREQFLDTTEGHAARLGQKLESEMADAVGDCGEGPSGLEKLWQLATDFEDFLRARGHSVAYRDEMDAAGEHLNALDEATQ